MPLCQAKRPAASPHYIHDIFMSPTVLYIADVVGGDLAATGNCDHLYLIKAQIVMAGV